MMTGRVSPVWPGVVDEGDVEVSQPGAPVTVVVVPWTVGFQTTKAELPIKQFAYTLNIN